MKLHFDEPKDRTKDTSAIYEFFIEENNDKPININKIRGKSLARLIEERKIGKHYSRKKHLKLQLHLLQILVILVSLVCLAMIAYLLYRVI